MLVHVECGPSRYVGTLMAVMPSSPRPWLRRIARGVQVITVQATVLERFAPPFQNTNLRCSHTAAAAAAYLRFIGASQRIGNRGVCAVGG